MNLFSYSITADLVTKDQIWRAEADEADTNKGNNDSITGTRGGITPSIVLFLK
jgi:hypothetical protein